MIYRYLFIFWCIVKSKEPRFWHFCLLNMNQDTDAEFTHFIFNKKRKKNSIWWVTTAYGGSWMGCTGPSGLQVKQSSYKKQNKTTKNVQLVEFNEHDEPNVGRLHEAPQDQNRSRQFSCRPANKLTKVLLIVFFLKHLFTFLLPGTIFIHIPRNLHRNVSGSAKPDGSQKGRFLGKFLPNTTNKLELLYLFKPRFIQIILFTKWNPM